jgi:tetratricopeptide (TPR) repeat protein
MIVKNAANTLRSCLQSVAGVVDQIVIADTGCTDATCEIALQFGANIVPFPWQDHFAHARNAALAAATTDWILVLDADEELGEEAKHSLPQLLSAPGIGGYVVPIREYVTSFTRSAWTATILSNDSQMERAKEAPSYFLNRLCRLFRRSPEIFFTGRVHEMVQPQVEAAGFAIGEAPFCIHHFGHLSRADAIKRKRLFYNDLLQKRLADEPNDLNALTMCGLDEWEVHKRPLEALRYLGRALELNPLMFEPWLITAKVLCGMHQYEQALQALEVVRHVEKDTCLQNTLRGDASYGLGRFEQAREYYEKAISASPNDPLLQAKRDYVDVDLGQAELAIPRLQRAANDLPEHTEIHEFLVNAYIRTGRIAEAADEAERFTYFDGREAFLLRVAKLRAQLKEWERVKPLAQHCVTMYPESAEGHELLMMSLLSLGNLGEAAAEAELLAGLVSEPRSFLRTASIYAQLDDKEKMRDCLERGLQKFPDSSAIERALAEIAAHTPIAKQRAEVHPAASVPC